MSRKLATFLLACGFLSGVLLLAQNGHEPGETASPAAPGDPSTEGSQVGTADTPPPPAVINNDPAFRRVTNRLACQCSCPYLVSSCNMVQCSSATYIRKTVQSALAAGKSEDDIVATFVGQYGPRILAEPPKTGFSLSAWVMPFLVLVLGGAFLSYFLWQWKSKFQPAAAGVAIPGAGGKIPGEGVPTTEQRSPALVEKYRAQIDKELEND